MSNAQFIRMYRDARRGGMDDGAVGNRRTMQVHAGVGLACHSAAPPAVAEYDRWLEGAQHGHGNGRVAVTGAKLRRMVTMKRNGCANSEIGRSVNISAQSVGDWLSRLPEGLAA